jgi:hypothetical protein
MAVGTLILVAGIVVALADAGVPLPGALVAAAGFVCIVVVFGAGGVGYRESRLEGRGFWRSVRSGIRTSFRTVFELF